MTRALSRWFSLWKLLHVTWGLTMLAIGVMQTSWLWRFNGVRYESYRENFGDLWWWGVVALVLATVLLFPTALIPNRDQRGSAYNLQDCCLILSAGMILLIGLSLTIGAWRTGSAPMGLIFLPWSIYGGLRVVLNAWDRRRAGLSGRVVVMGEATGRDGCGD